MPIVYGISQLWFRGLLWKMKILSHVRTPNAFSKKEENFMSKVSIYGHAYTRAFIYTYNGYHHEFNAPGGAALLKLLLDISGTDIRESYGEPFYMFFELKKYIDKKDYWAIDRRLGISYSDFMIEDCETPRNLLIWHEGLGEFNPPKTECPVLWASNKVLPYKEKFAKVASNCLVFLDADVLREAGAMISRQISWERTATELIWQLQNNPAISHLMQAPHILIAFAEDGAVYLRRENGELKAELVLTHGGGEGTLRAKLQGEIDDAFILMTASLAHQFTEVISGEKPLRVLPILKTAETIMTTGYSIEGLQNGEYKIITETEEAENMFAIPLKSGQNAIDPDKWCISNNVGGKRVFDIAFNYVLNGNKEIDGLPRLSFGALTTVDRWEIEAFQNIRNLIVGYAESNSVRPLSIAVFGSPGSGKSFGVTQIAKNVLPGKVEKLEFNVSQFTGLADLGAAFQKVRDVILDGKLPLVFFDEFDSDRDGRPLGWLKSFLMPMQDGKFKDESGEHPLGKCILVFAGGTAASFEEFCMPMNPRQETVIDDNASDEIDSIRSFKKNLEDAQKELDFKNIKGPDFISRLKGTINVLGPNQKDENDKNYILRRALLLRSLCERKLDMKKGQAPISPNIIWAMLLVPKYKHGARSMEAILDMSRLEGNVWEPVSLPFYSQLSIHVDADAFVKLILREVILNSYIEQLAQAIHADFVKEMTAAGKTDHSTAVPWDDLPEEFKESNRDVARNYGKKLNSVGYDYDAGDTPFPSVEEFDDKTLMLLAQNEHIRWMSEKIANGWQYAPVRDNEKKHHTLIVDWDKLPPEEQKKDFNVAKNIIPLLKSIGLRVYKTV
ncbi:MAG TPA: hypothetical protein DEQ02_08680 [Ruminococcaceae bacterium]|nr:hypothetical protein [Oscillospiraceae bacterium]